jgi:hypothetical protein
VIVAGRARRRRRSACDLRRHARAQCALACRDQRALAPSLLKPVCKYACVRTDRRVPCRTPFGTRDLGCPGGGRCALVCLHSYTHG